MLAKIQAGATGYDLIWPSVHMNDIMLQLGLLEKTDINQAGRGFKNIDPGALRSKQDPKAEYCMPYAWGLVGIFYNKQVVGGELTSWKGLFDYTAKNSGQDIGFEEDLSVRNRNDIRRDVRGHVAGLGFDDRQSSHRSAAILLVQACRTLKQARMEVEYVARIGLTTRRTSQQERNLAVGAACLDR